MGRRRSFAPLNVFLNTRLVGQLLREKSGAISFAYDRSWLEWEHRMPISLSLPLREDRFLGGEAIPVFDNLLPDNPTIRRRVAERVGAAGTSPQRSLTCRTTFRKRSRHRFRALFPNA
ncbi:HipA N-terminal domain-containing protein [Rhodovulum visakhapatnamense]|uniref:HipA-like protein n=1 Tax=Rhodovulum visakhapatnamense TaxID=364297 RepID=A0A4V6QAK1_9RHOB|nr:HipA N-terminal domain-containing protein [Rhodovulum visakhapatnamense]TDX21253.1 HipA-like protein [Rhodovulum visakhapatnamense]